MYKVTHSEGFGTQVEKLYSSHSRTEELYKAIEWVLQHKPRLAYHLCEDYFLWVTDQLPVKTIPKVKIVYKVNDQLREVILISIAEQVDSNLS